MVLENAEVNKKCDEIDSIGNSSVWTSAGKSSNSDEKCFTYEEAIDLAGSGRYNVWLLCVSSVTIVSMGLDMFGFSVVVAGSTCDLDLTLAQKGILTSMPFAGAITMAYPWGYLSDTRGRRKCLIVAMSVSFMFSVLGSFSPNWIVMAVFKMLSTSFSSSAQSISYSLLGECCSRRVRGTYTMIMSSTFMTYTLIYFCFAYICLNMQFSYDLGLWGMTFKPWRLLSLIMALFLGLAALGLTFCYESPKFLANQNRIEEAINILKKMYAINRPDCGQYPIRNLVLNEEGNAIPRGEGSILVSIWNQTAPLFRPPLLWKTLQLYYLTALLYSTNNSFLMWYPFITNAFFVSYGRQDTNIKGLCSLITGGFNVSTPIENYEDVVCNDTLEDLTLYSGIVISMALTIMNVIISNFAKRKKILALIIFFASAVGGATTNLVPEPFTALALFMLFFISAIAVGVIFSYFVDLYPTSYRGMVACLAVMVARGSSLIGTNLVGALITDYCTTTFYVCSVYMFSGVVVAWFLPPDKAPKK